MTKQELIQKFEDNIEKARYVYNNGEKTQMQMREIISMLEAELKKFKELV
jgi:archaellum component FlaC